MNKQTKIPNNGINHPLASVKDGSAFKALLQVEDDFSLSQISDSYIDTNSIKILKCDDPPSE
jgi:hypothetical protein